MTTVPTLRSINGGASTKEQAAAYGLDPAFERAMVTLLCKSASLYGKIGSAMDVSSLSQSVAQLALKAAQDYAKEVGKGPGSLLVVIQRLSRWREDGKLTQAKVVEVSDLFDACEDAGLPSEEAVLAEMTPILQSRARQSAIRLAMEDFAKGGDLSRVEQALAKAKAIGRTSDADGSILGGASFDAIDAMRLMERLPTGITELDLLLDGGFPRGLSIYVGSSGAGKSMALAHSASEGVYQQLHVGVVSLELPEEIQTARVIANLTGTPINDLLNGRQQRAKDRLAQMLAGLGVLTVRYMSPRATKVDDIFRWVEQREQKVGRKMDLLVVDYLDKLSSGTDQSAYEAQGTVADSLRDYAVGRSMFCLTASQATRGGGKGGKSNALDLDHIADSMHKARVADVVLTLRKDEEQQTMDIFLAKNRVGRSRVGTGALPQDEVCGRIVNVSRRCGW